MRGFTLLEFLIYIGIVGAVLFAAGAIGMNVLFEKAKLSALAEVSENARISLEVMESSVRNATQILSPALGMSGPSLSLEMSDPTKNPTVFNFSLGAVYMKEGTALPIPLTGKNIVVRELLFTNVSSPGTAGTVQIRFSASSTNPSKRPEYEFSQTYYGTENIRP